MDATAYWPQASFVTGQTYYFYVQYRRSTSTLVMQIYNASQALLTLSNSNTTATFTGVNIPAWSTQSLFTFGGTTGDYGNLFNGTIQNIIISSSLLTSQAALFSAPPAAPSPSWTSGIDGVVPTAGMRVLLVAQTNPVENGIYLVPASNTALTRTTDLTTGSSASGAFVFINSTSITNGNAGRVCTSLPGSDVVGTNALTWAVFTSVNGKIGTTTISGGSITDASGTLSFGSNALTTGGLITAGSANVGTLRLRTGQITDTSGSLSFGSTNVTSNASVSTGTLTVSSGNITDSSGVISLGATDIVTTGTMLAAHFTTPSDERLKVNIRSLSRGLEALDNIDGHAFEWLSDGSEDTGLIAQEIMQVAPEVVHINPISGMYTVDYSRLVPYLLRWIKLLRESIRSAAVQTS
jgi:hypothetical protein